MFMMIWILAIQVERKSKEDVQRHYEVQCGILVVSTVNITDR